eukprot:Seg1864.4 transcript_id=Seg1864.4/GoldUCD/mRNA.D3Y31 product="hypothetical protein" pseudo=true protein_id=Seg1864.4/GoldUCD/D3Y31
MLNQNNPKLKLNFNLSVEINWISVCLETKTAKAYFQLATVTVSPETWQLLCVIDTPANFENKRSNNWSRPRTEWNACLKCLALSGPGD